MRDVLGHPFFGIGKLAGVAPVFVRPKLGLPGASNVIDIVAPDHEEMSSLINAVKKAEATSGIRPSPQPSRISPVAQSVQGPEPSRQPQSTRTTTVIPTQVSIPVTGNAPKKSKFGIKSVFGKKK
jgi:hypothetical protein